MVTGSNTDIYLFFRIITKLIFFCSTCVRIGLNSPKWLEIQSTKISIMEKVLEVDHEEEKELRRGKVVDRYKLLTSTAKKALDEVTHLARQIFDVSIAMVCFVDLHQVFVQSSSSGEIPEASNRTTTLCSRAVLNADVTVIKDKDMENYLLANPVIAREQGLEFYAAAPLITAEGLNIGTICLLDTKNRTFSQEDKEILTSFSRVIMSSLELCHSSIIGFNRS